jgi:hypothetical protein
VARPHGVEGLGLAGPSNDLVMAISLQCVYGQYSQYKGKTKFQKKSRKWMQLPFFFSTFGPDFFLVITRKPVLRLSFY